MVRELIEDLPALASFGHQAVRAEACEVLRCPRVGYAKELSERCHVVLAAADLLNDPKATGVPKNGKCFGKYSAGKFSKWHINWTSPSHSIIYCHIRISEYMI
jgi:hypothetical protein